MNISPTDSNKLAEAIAECLRNAGILTGKEGEILTFNLTVTGADSTQLMNYVEYYEVSSYPTLDPTMSTIVFCDKHNVSARIKNSLLKGQPSWPELPTVKTVREILLLTEERLRQYRGIGDYAVNQLKEALARYGLSLQKS